MILSHFDCPSPSEWWVAFENPPLYRVNVGTHPDRTTILSELLILRQSVLDGAFCVIAFETLNGELTSAWLPFTHLVSKPGRLTIEGVGMVFPLTDTYTGHARESISQFSSSFALHKSTLALLKCALLPYGCVKRQYGSELTRPNTTFSWLFPFGFPKP